MMDMLVKSTVFEMSTIISDNKAKMQLFSWTSICLISSGREVYFSIIYFNVLVSFKFFFWLKSNI